MPKRSTSSADRNPKLDPGFLGEALVAQWLLDNGWEIWARRWRCRWGEIDIIAAQTQSAQKEDFVKSNLDFGLAFVEVKTRSRGSWDAGGLLAIAPSKQAKLLRTAELFLASRPELADFPCRFDVALVNCLRLPRQAKLSKTESPHPSTEDPLALPSPVDLGQPVRLGDYRLTLHRYIAGAFDA